MYILYIYVYIYIQVWDIYRNKYTYKMHLEYIIYTVLYSTGILEIGGWHHEWRLSLVSRLCATLILKFSSETLWDQLGNPINPWVWSCYGEFRVPIIKFRGQLVGATAEITIVVVVTGTKPFWPQSSINLYITYINDKSIGPVVALLSPVTNSNLPSKCFMQPSWKYPALLHWTIDKPDNEPSGEYILFVHFCHWRKTEVYNGLKHKLCAIHQFSNSVQKTCHKNVR